MRNNNSSRFGKYIALRFDERSQLLGAEAASPIPPCISAYLPASSLVPRHTSRTSLLTY